MARQSTIRRLIRTTELAARDQGRTSNLLHHYWHIKFRPILAPQIPIGIIRSAADKLLRIAVELQRGAEM